MLRMIAQMLWRKRRNIFHYNDGRKVCSADPIAVSIALHEHKEFLPRHLNDAASGDPEAMMIVAKVACDVFGLSPLAANEKTGLTVTERIELMLAFDAYVFALKKNIELSLTKRGFTGSTSQASSEPITNVTSDSGSTATASLSEPPTESGPESLPRSEN